MPEQKPNTKRKVLRMTRRGKVTIFVFLCLFMGGAVFMSTSKTGNDTASEQMRNDVVAIHQAKECLSFYDSNKKMPQIKKQEGQKILYDHEHLMLIHQNQVGNETSDKSKEKEEEVVNSAVITNYRWRSGEANETESDIWAFVDLFPDETSKISRVVYFDADAKNPQDSWKEITRDVSTNGSNGKEGIKEKKEKSNLLGFSDFLSLIY